MSDTVNEFETVDENAEPGKLRQLLKKAIADLKQKEAKIAELETAEAQRTVKTTWDELKVPDFVRGMYHGDTSPDAIKAWWENSKGFFNVEAAEEAPKQPEPSPQEVAQRTAAQQLQEASALGANAYQSGFDAVKNQADQAKEAYLKGGLSRADYDAAVAKVYEGLSTPKL